MSRYVAVWSLKRGVLENEPLDAVGQMLAERRASRDAQSGERMPYGSAGRHYEQQREEQRRRG